MEHFGLINVRKKKLENMRTVQERKLAVALNIKVILLS